jgi:hypothetical protein
MVGSDYDICQSAPRSKVWEVHQTSNQSEVTPGQTMDRDETRRWLGYIVNIAINRKAGIPDWGCRKRDPEYQIRLRRDCVDVRNWVNHRMRFYSLETAEIRKRFGDMVPRYNE